MQVLLHFQIRTVNHNQDERGFHVYSEATLIPSLSGFLIIQPKRMFFCLASCSRDHTFSLTDAHSACPCCSLSSPASLRPPSFVSGAVPKLCAEIKSGSSYVSSSHCTRLRGLVFCRPGDLEPLMRPTGM